MNWHKKREHHLNNPGLKIAGCLLFICIHTFTCLAQSERSSRAPEIQSFLLDPDLKGAGENSVNLYSGDVNLPVSLVSVPGRGGLNMNVGLVYNSNIRHTRDTWPLEAPTGILGLGWSMDYDKIVVDHKQTGNRHDDDFYLISGGASNQLIQTGYDLSNSSIKIYETKTYQFWKIRYIPYDERWEITKEDGNTYVFGSGVTTDAGGNKSSERNTVQWGVKWGNWIGASGRTRGQQQHAIAWNLSKVKDRWGNELLYEYDQVMEDVGEHGQPDNVSPKQHTKASYLKKITNSEGKNIEFFYREKQADEYADPHTAIPELTVYIDGPTTFRQEDGYAEWTAKPSGGAPPYSYQWEQRTTYLVNGQCSTDPQWQLGTTSQTTGRTWSDGICRIDLRVTVTDAQPASASALHTVWYESSSGSTIQQTETQSSEASSTQTATALDEPDAYQEKFETRYLDKVVVANESGATLYSFIMNYGFYGTAGEPDYNRLLTGITQSNSAGETLPEMKFKYYGATAVHPAALETVTWPMGGQVTYTYSETSIVRSQREKLVQAPAGYYAPRIFISRDYVVTTWLKSDRLKVQVHTWDGEWLEDSFEISEFDGVITNSKQNFEIFLGDDFFVLLTNVYEEAVADRIFVASKDPDRRSQWRFSSVFSLLTNNRNVDVLTGDDFFVTLDRTSGEMYHYRWDGLLWSSSHQGALTSASDPNYFIGGTNNYFVFDDEHSVGPDILTIYYLDEKKQWQTSSIPTSVTQFESLTDQAGEKNKITADHSHFSIMARDTWEGIFRLKEDYTLAPVTNIGSLNDTWPSYTYNNSIIDFQQFSDNNKPRMYRFDGIGWRSTVFKDFYIYSLGDDIIVKLNRLYSGEEGEWLRYDPNTSKWETIETLTGTPEVTYPQIGNRFFVMGDQAHYVHPDKTRTLLGQLAKPVGGTINYRTVGAGLSFVAYQVSTQDPADPYRTYIYPIKNGDIATSAPIILPEAINGSTSSYQRSDLIERATLVTYNNDDNIESSDWVKLYRMMDEKAEGSLKDYPITSISVNDGYQNQSITFSYHDSSATYDPTGSLVQYNKVTIAQGSGEGYTEHYFFNGLASGDSDLTEPYPTGSLTNAASYESIIKGLPYATKTYDSNDNLKSSVENYWWVYPQLIKRTSDDANIAEAHWIFRRKTETTVDGVLTSVERSFDANTGLPTQTTTYNYDVDGNENTHTTLYTYWWQENDPDRSENLLAPVIRTETQVNSTTTGVTATTWKTWSNGSDSTEAPHKSYRWKGTGSPVFDFTNWSDGNEPPADWLKTSRIDRRDTFGNITGITDVEGIVSTRRMVKNGTRLGASFTNAAPPETGFINMDTFRSTTYGELADGLEVYDSGDGILAYSSASGPVNASAQRIEVDNLTSGSAGAYVDLSGLNPGEEYILDFEYKLTEGKLNVLVNSSTSGTASDTYYETKGRWITERIEWTYQSGQHIYFRAPLNGSGATNVTLRLDNIRIYPADAYATSYTYDSRYQQATGVMDQDNRVSRTTLDEWGRTVARSESGGAYSEQRYSLSAERNGGLFLAGDPNRAESITLRGDGAPDSVANGLLMKGYNSQLFATDIDATLWRRISDSTAAGQKYSGDMSNSWGSGYPSGIGITDGETFTVTWEGQIWLDYAEEYSFILDVDNYGFMELFVDGQWVLVVKDIHWDPAQGNITWPVDIEQPGWYPVRMGLAEVGSTARFVLEYSSARTTRQTVPAGKLRYIPPVKSITYSDGLGRTIQTQDWNGSGGDYIVSHTEYDNLGRPSKAWKPYLYTTGAKYDTSFAAHAESYYGATGARLYEETLYEADPLSRKRKVIPPDNGTAGIEYAYGSGSIGTNLFNFTDVTGLDGVTGRSYRDRQGATVRTIAAVGTAEEQTSETKTDPISRTTQSRPPHWFSPPGSSVKADWVSAARGDFLGRTIETTSPDADTTRNTYDDAGKLRFTQDANQKAAGQVGFTRYDALGRAVASGEAAAGFATLDGNQPYAFETDDLNQIQATAYDDKPSSTVFPWSLFATELGGASLTHTHGKLVAEAFKTDGRSAASGGSANSKNWQLTLYSYDAQGRLVTKQIFTQGAPELETLVEYSYNHLGDLLKQHVRVGTGQNFYHFYEYDQMGRVVKIYTNTSDQKPVTPEVVYAYNESGQLETEDISGQTAADMHYFYDLRGRLDSLAGGDTTFTEAIAYNPAGTIASASFTNGAGSYAYSFAYDTLGRLTEADYSEGTTAFDVGGLSYDRHGNLKTLNRWYDPSLIDQLIYSHVTGTNRLASVTDGAASTENDTTALVIYDEPLRFPWTNSSWGAAVDFANTGRYIEGTTAVKADLNGWGGLRVHAGPWNYPANPEISLYDSLRFWIWPDSAGAVLVGLSSEAGGNFPTVILSDLPAGQWSRVEIPLASLSPEGDRPDQIRIVNYISNPRTFWVDSWGLHRTAGDITARRVLAADSLAAPWINSSWAATVDFANTERTYSGAAAVKATLDEWGGLRVHSGSWNDPIGQDLTPYDTLSFRLWAASSEPILVGLSNADPTTSFKAVILDSVPAGQWIPVEIPLAGMDAAGKAADQVRIVNYSTATRTLWVDDWQLSGDGGPADRGIAGEALHVPWINASWGAAVDLANTGQAYKGKNSVQVQQDAAGAFSVHYGHWGASRDFSGRESVRFHLRPAGADMPVSVNLENDAGDPFPRIDYGSVPADTWSLVEVAMAGLNPDGYPAHRLDIKTSDGSPQTYFVDELSLQAVRPPAVAADWDARDASFTWDASGNMTSNSGKGITDISYDIRNLPLSMSLDNGLQVTYRYNSSGWRIHKRVEDNGTPSIDEHYIMDGGTLLAVTDSSGAVQFWNMYGNGLIGRYESGGSKKYYLRDHLGSTRQVIDDTGTLLEYYDYYPFGLVLRSNVAGQQTKETFTGKEQDPATGYYYFGARYYDAALGGWGVTDPAGQFASPYVYGGNSPLMYIDPDGKVAWFVPVIIGAALGAYTGASIQSGTANFTNWDADAWKGAIVGGIVGAGAGAMFSSAIGAAGITTQTTNAAGVTVTQASKGWGIATSIINNANINMGIGALSGGSVDELWKYGVSGAVSGAYSATGGLGLVKAFGAKSKLLQFGGRLAYQASSTTLASIGNNWAAGSDLFSNLTVGVGPVNLTVRGDRVLRWQNNIENIFWNALGLTNYLSNPKKGSIGFDSSHLTLKYQGGIYNYNKATGANTIIGGLGATLSPGDALLAHEQNHLWLSRALSNRYALNYIQHGFLSVLSGGKFSKRKYNYYEELGWGNYWGF